MLRNIGERYRELSRPLLGQMLLFTMLLFASCAPARKPIPPGVIPEPQAPTTSEEQYGHQVLTGLSEKYELDYDHPRYNNVIEVVERLTRAAGANAHPWHVYLFKDDKFTNAAATRGNHVFIWTAMLDKTKSDDELAAILAHEIAHVLAGHTEPDPSEQLKKILIGVGAMAANIAIVHSTGDPTLGRNLGNLTGTLTQEVGKGFLLNPYSREMELEADQVGLFLMAAAGYNPEKALDFWGRVQKDPDFSSGVEFFSTHPSAPDRLKRLQLMLPDAMKWYKFGVPENTSSPTPVKKSSSAVPHQEDSFDISETHHLSTVKTRRLSQWKVTAAKAVLYQSASTKSRPIGEFSRGAEVQAVRVTKDWVELSSPDRGFVHRKLLRQLDN